MMTAALFACIMSVSQYHGVPPAVVYAIRQQEGGQVGKISRNKNGSYDIGPMQINNRAWLDDLSERWGMPKSQVEQIILHKECANIEAATWILAGRVRMTGDLWKGVAAYHSFTPKYSGPYLEKVVSRIRANISVQQKQIELLRRRMEPRS